MLALWALALLGLLHHAAGQAQSDNRVFRLRVDPPAISPDSDGIQDIALIRLENVPEDLREPADWYCRIVDSNGRIVRSFVADRRLRRPERGPTNLWLPGRDTIEAVRLFEQILWDGRNTEGAIVADGVYRVETGVQPGPGDIHVNATAAELLVSRSRPTIEVRPVASWFVHSPGAPPPGRSDTERLELRQTIRSPRESLAFGRLLSLTRGALQERRWDSSAPAAIYVYWDEVNIPETQRYGDYSYELIVRDRAGNQARALTQNFGYRDQRYALDLRADRYLFSPNGDGVRDSFRADLWPVDDRGQERARTLLRQMHGWRVEVRSFPANDVVFSEEGAGTPPETVHWDGRNKGGQIVSEGLYQIQLRGPVAGQQWSTPARMLAVDLSPPRASFSLSPSVLRPERPDQPGWVELSMSPTDNIALDSWQIQIRLKPVGAERDPLQQPFRSYQGWAAPEPIVWNGASDSGIPSESLERFVVEATLSDSAGNTATVRGPEIESDIIFRPLKEGAPELAARIPAFGLFDQDNELTARGRSALDRLIARIDRYPRYRLSLESHTALPGREESNLRLSETRSRAMFEYLRRHGVEREQIEFRGFGESEAMMPGRDPFSNYQNDRIEARLLLRPQLNPSFE
ncbi:MAG: OmpA family protein [Leptospirales bacterium]|nr:OmpA family protein [Leptospirales bacterium]